MSSALASRRRSHTRARPGPTEAVACAECGVVTPVADQYFTDHGVQCLDCHLEEPVAAPVASWPQWVVHALGSSLMPAWVSWFVVSLVQLGAAGGWEGRAAVEMVLLMSAALGVLAVAMVIAGVAEVRQVTSGAAAQIEAPRTRLLRGVGGAWWALNGLGSLALLVALFASLGR